MEKGKRININPIDDVAIHKDFQKEVGKMMSLGLSEIQAGCYISNYHDDYICDTFNGGCKCKSKCESVSKNVDQY